MISPMYDKGKFIIRHRATVNISFLTFPVASKPVVNVLDIDSLMENRRIRRTKFAEYSGTSPNHKCNIYSVSTSRGSEMRVSKHMANLLPLNIICLNLCKSFAPYFFVI